VAAAAAARGERAHASAHLVVRCVLAKAVDTAVAVARHRELLAVGGGGGGGAGGGPWGLPAPLARDHYRVFASDAPAAATLLAPLREYPPVGAAACAAAATYDTAPGAAGCSSVVAAAGVAGEEEDASAVASGMGDGCAGAAGRGGCDGSRGVGPSPGGAAAVAALSRLALEDYAVGAGRWADPAPRIDLRPAAAVGAEAAEAGTLGRVFAALRAATPAGVAAAEAAAAAAAAATAALPPRFPVQGAIIGGPFSGKSAQAARLAERRRLRVLSPDALLREALSLAGAGGGDGGVTSSGSGPSPTPTPGGGGGGGFGASLDGGGESWAGDARALGATAAAALRAGREVPDEVRAAAAAAAAAQVLASSVLLYFVDRCCCWWWWRC
jgi:hypothetical protein